MPVFKEETIKGKKYTFWYITEMVVDINDIVSINTTHETSSDHDGRINSSTSSRSVHDFYIWIKRDSDGLEQKYWIGDSNLVRTGNRVALFFLSIEKGGREETLPCTLYNFASKDLWIIRKGMISSKYSPSSGCLWSLFLPIFIYPLFKMPQVMDDIRWNGFIESLINGYSDTLRNIILISISLLFIYGIIKLCISEYNKIETLRLFLINNYKLMLYTVLKDENLSINAAKL